MTNSHEDYMLWLEVERRTREWGAKFQAMTAELHAKDEQIELARNRAEHDGLRPAQNCRRGRRNRSRAGRLHFR